MAAAAVEQLRLMPQSPEVIVATWRAARKVLPDLTECQSARNWDPGIGAQQGPPVAAASEGATGVP